MLDILRQDLLFALRQVRRNPGFTAVAVVTLALGIGTTTAIFSVVRSVLIEPLRYPEPSRLVYIQHRVTSTDTVRPWPASEVTYWDYGANTPALAQIGAYSTGDIGVGDGTSEARRLPSVRVTASLLGTLGAQTAAGRLFTAEDDRPGAPPVALLSYAYFQSAFAGDPSIVGRTLRIDGRPVEVVGVLARDFRLPRDEADVWVPAQFDPAAVPNRYYYLSVVGRLAPGVSLEQLDSQLDARVAGFTTRFPEVFSPQFMQERGFQAEAVPLRGHVLGDVGRGLWMLLASVALMLLIACANVANLFLVRTEARRRELAVRAAAGAGRRRLAGHYMVESVVLSLIAGVLAVGIGHATLGLLLYLAPEWLPRLTEIRVGVTGAMFALGVSLVAGVLFGLFPVLRFGTGHQALREASRSLSVTPRDKRARVGLMAGQVALAVVLVTAGALLVRSFMRLQSVEPGFQAQSVLTVEIALPRQQYGDYATTSALWRQLVEATESIPGVSSAGAGAGVPILGTDFCDVLWIEDQGGVDGEATQCIPIATVTPGYFEALGIPIRGSAPTWSDLAAGTGAVVVSHTLAEQLWPGEDPIGKGIRGRGPGEPGAGERYYRVVGVTGELRMRGLDQPPSPVAFFPVQPASDRLQLWGPYVRMELLARTSGIAPSSVVGAIRKNVSSLGPDVAVGQVRTMSEIVSGSVARITFALLLLGLAGGLAVLLAAVGIYAGIAYLVERRREEIGVRIALGSSTSRVGRMVVTESLRTAAVGIALGLIVSLLLGRLLRAFLFEVSPYDALSLAAGAALVLVVAVVASVIPALRAAQVDPAQSLRAE